MAETRAQDYAEKLDDLVHMALAMPESARKAVLDQLRQAPAAVRADIAHVEPGSLSADRHKALKAEIDRVMQQFSQAAAGDVAKAQQAMYTSASRGVSATLQTATQRVPVLPVIDTRQLAIAQNYSADLITGLSSSVATKINTAIQRAALGGSTMPQLIQQIGGALEGGTFSGYFSEAGERASTIATNEVLRVHSLASMARLTDFAKSHDGIAKEWLHIPASLIPRATHILASGQTRQVDEPFTVAGEELMYPRDPSGSPSNTINCHCLVRPKVDPALLQPTDREREALKLHGLRIVTSRS